MRSFLLCLEIIGLQKMSQSKSDESFGCKRCGYCCIYLDVVIMRLVEGECPRFYYKPYDHHCPNLTFDGAIASCAIHENELFEECPCHSHNNRDLDPDILIWGDVWRCIGPKLVAQKIYEVRPPKKVTWEELSELGD